LTTPQNVNNLLTSYARKVLSVNNDLNLVSRQNALHIIDSLIFESLPLLDWEECHLQSPILDIGTGGGIPGIPLAIKAPDKQFILMDSKRAKTLFITHCATTLGLQNVSVMHAKAESMLIGSDYQAKYGTIVSRAVTTFNNLLLWSSFLLKDGGELILWKGSRSVEEKYFLDRDIWTEPLFKPIGEGLVMVRFERLPR